MAAGGGAWGHGWMRANQAVLGGIAGTVCVAAAASLDLAAHHPAPSLVAPTASPHSSTTTTSSLVLLAGWRTACLALMLVVHYTAAVDPTGLSLRSDRGGRYTLSHHRKYATFTMACWSLQTLYIGIGLAVAVARLLSPRPGPVVRALTQVGWRLFEVSLVCAGIVTAVSFLVLMPAAYFFDPVAFQRTIRQRPLTLHLANLAIMLVERHWTRTPVVARHRPFLLLWLGAYCLWALYFHHRTGVAIYFFAHPARWFSPLALLAILLLAARLYRALAVDA